MICMARWRVTCGGSRYTGRGRRCKEVEEEKGGEQGQEGGGKGGAGGGGVTATLLPERARAAAMAANPELAPFSSPRPRAPND